MAFVITLLNMSRQLKHDTVRAVDPDGREVVGVKMSVPEWMTTAPADCRAWVYAEDYARIVATYGERRWYLNRGSGRTKPFVRVRKVPGLPTTLARFITGNYPRTSVRYVNDDHLNLRRRNLALGGGHGGKPKTNRNRWTTLRHPYSE
jgi:hypothetical protein